MMLLSCSKKFEKEKNAPEFAGRLCYIHFENKDSVNMTLTVQYKKVSGELMYKLFEKDRNDGHLNGVLLGDTIIAYYEFESEGIKSVREVAFLRKENTLLKGFGPMDITGTRFTSHRDLNFSGIELQKTNCP